MTFNNTAVKSIFSSVTFWGSILTAFGIAAPSVAAKLGITSANSATIAQWIVGAAGTVVTIYGRFTATQAVSLTGK